MDSKPSLFIAIPAYQGVQAGCFMSVMSLQQLLAAHGIVSTVGLVSQNSFLPDARNRLVARFIETGMSHVLLLDADITFAAETVLRMLDTRRDFVCAAVPLRRTNWDGVAFAAAQRLSPIQAFANQYNVRFKEQDRVFVDEDGLVEILFAGTAFLLVRADALRKMIDRYQSLLYETDDGATVCGLFHPIIEQRVLYSEDISFTKRWIDMGGRIWLYPKATMTHSGPGDFTGTFSDAMEGASRMEVGDGSGDCR